MSEERYSRQTILEGVGEDGQAKLAAARVVVVGCGGLGSPAAAYLAGAGVGHLRLIDGDVPELSNLHRQVFYRSDVPASKTQQLATHLKQLNPTISVSTAPGKLDESNVRQLLNHSDLVLDCTDDALTKHLINDACVLAGTPLVYAAAQGFAGYVALFENKPGGIHLRDVYPNPDTNLPDCATAGVLPTAVGIVALLQANAALCYLLGIGDPPIDRLLTYSALDNRQLTVRLKKSYAKAIELPVAATKLSASELEITAATLTPPGFTRIYSMLTEAREPELPAGVERISNRNPLGDCLARMVDGERYLLYCNSGKLSLVVAAQLRKQRPDLAVYSLRGGIKGL